MKSLKFELVLTIMAGILLSLSSCKKHNDAVTTVSKEQLLGKWNMVIQASNGPQSFHAVLKASGAMELDAAPYDGIVDLILLWDVSGNNFNAHIDANGISNYWDLHAPVDPKTLTLAGQFIINAKTPPESDIFTMEKQ